MSQAFDGELRRETRCSRDLEAPVDAAVRSAVTMCVDQGIGLLVGHVARNRFDDLPRDAHCAPRCLMRLSCAPNANFVLVAVRITV